MSTPTSMAISTGCTGMFISVGAWFKNMQDAHIPPIIIEWLAVGSYTIGSVIGLITIYKFFKKEKPHD